MRFVCKLFYKQQLKRLHSAPDWLALCALIFVSWQFSFAQEQKKVVILSASYGSGHNTSANAIAKQLRDMDPTLDVEILYTEKYMRFGLGDLSVNAFSTIYQKFPDFYDHRFQSAMKGASNKSTAAEIPNLFFNEKALLKDLVRKDPVLVFSTYHYASIMLLSLRAKGLIGPENFKIGWVDTDFVHEKFFYLISFGVEKTFMAHPLLTEERIRDYGVPAERVVTTGLPINQQAFLPFTEADRQTFLKGAFKTPDQMKHPETKTWFNGEWIDPRTTSAHFDPNAFTVTIASGRAGLGDYAKIFKGLVEQAHARGIKEQVLAVCGDNQKNFDQLVRFYHQEAQKGEMKNIDLAITHLMDNQKLINFMRSSQVFIGKSGSQSPIEAAILGVPSVLLDVLGGQEHHTAEFFRKNNLAEVVYKNEQAQTGAKAFAYIEDPERMRKLKVGQQLTKDSYTMTPIADFARESIQEAIQGGHVKLTRRSSSPIIYPCNLALSGR